VLYKSSDFYDTGSERVILWNDPDLAIDWEVQGQPVLSAKDAAARRFREAEVFE